MTNEQKELIVIMRQSGYGYRKIGNKLELSKDEVKNYCKVRHLCGGVMGQKILLKDDETVCIQCGKLIVNKATGRKRKYCSHECYVQDRFYSKILYFNYEFLTWFWMQDEFYSRVLSTRLSSYGNIFESVSVA